MTRDQFLCEEVMHEKWDMTQEEYACHCDIFDGEEPDECVLDSYEYNENDCIYARKGMDKKTCEYWKPVKKHIINLNFSLWPDKGRLIDKVMGEEWWEWFYDAMREKYNYSGQGRDEGRRDHSFTKYLIDNFPDLVAEYQEYKEKGK